MIFKFKPRKESDQDERAQIVNAVSQLLWDKLVLDPREILSFYDMFDNTIENFYEIIEDSTPLMAYVLLHNKDKAMDNYGINEREYQKEAITVGKACEKYFGGKRKIVILQEVL